MFLLRASGSSIVVICALQCIEALVERFAILKAKEEAEAIDDEFGAPQGNEKIVCSEFSIYRSVENERLPSSVVNRQQQ